jgi:hypothetical protein
MMMLLLLLLLLLLMMMMMMKKKKKMMMMMTTMAPDLLAVDLEGGVGGGAEAGELVGRGSQLVEGLLRLQQHRLAVLVAKAKVACV